MIDPYDYGVFAEQIRDLQEWTATEANKAEGTWWEQIRHLDYSASAPIVQWSAWNEYLPSLQASYEANPDSRILFKAVEICLNRGLPVPRWCAQPFVNSWRKVEGYEVRTLDEAFSYSNKGVNLHDARRRRLLADKVTIEALMLIGEGSTRENALREIASKEAISYELASKWYYANRVKFDFLQESENS